VTRADELFSELVELFEDHNVSVRSDFTEIPATYPRVTVQL